MERIKTFMLKNRWYFIGALVLLAITIGWFKYKFANEVEKTIAYINTNPDAAGWKNTIAEKAKTAGRTYEQQLLLDARYMVKSQNSGNPFKWLI